MQETMAVVGGIVATVGAAWRWSCLRKPVRQTHLRGCALRPVHEVEPLLHRLRKADDPGLLLGRQLFPSSVATRHLAIIGTTGSGKTLLQRLLMQSALQHLGGGREQRALVYDAKQDVLSLLGGMQINAPIHVLHPLDARSVAWDMAADITNPASALQVASMLVPEQKQDVNPFFSNAARQIIYGVLLALMEQAPSRWTLRHVLLVLRDLHRTCHLLAGSLSTRHLLQYFAHPSTAQNIFSSLLTHTGPYEIIAACWDRAGDSLSLTDWLAGESVLVLGNDEANRTALDTINRLLFRRVSELVLAGPEVNDTGRRTWFFLDEVREAGRLDLLSRLLTKGRSKGVAVVLGFQDISGMRDAYGREVADEILGQCNTKIILRLNSPETAAWAAKLFGNREVLETRRGRSRTHRMSLNGESSSGVSVSHSIVRLPVVLDSEILSLPETSRADGLTALFTNPATGPFLDHLPGPWLTKALMSPDSTIPNFVPRPDSHQYLRPWTQADDDLLGLKSPDAQPELNSWCQ